MVAIPVDKEIKNALYKALEYLKTNHKCRILKVI